MKLTTDFSNERAVSPVVGVILMVAITVILAAVIGTFVLDLGSDQTAPPRAGITFEQTGTNQVTATVNSAGNVDSLSTQVSEASGGSLTASVNTNFDNYDVGDEAVIDNVESGDDITVIGTNNGQEGIVAEYTA